MDDKKITRRKNREIKRFQERLDANINLTKKQKEDFMQVFILAWDLCEECIYFYL